jgi:hypothetical protein
MWIRAFPDLVSETLVFHVFASRANGSIYADPDPVFETLVYHVLASRAIGCIHADPDSVSETLVFHVVSMVVSMRIPIPYPISCSHHGPNRTVLLYTLLYY